LKEEEIRPRKVFDEYLRLAADDAEIYFGGAKRSPLSCPACGETGEHAFDKHGFSYEECPACQTLFVSPRPPAEDFFRYYKESASARYFGTTFYRETAEARREKLWRPKATMIYEVLRERGASGHHVIDIGGGYGIFAEEYQRIAGGDVTVIEPGPDSAGVCRSKGLRVIETFLEMVEDSSLPSGPRAFVSFELFEHLHDSRVFLERLRSHMRPGDLFLFTTLSGMGVDIQALWENSNSVSLQHLNFFNPRSVRILVESFGMSAVKITTPGKLDIDILFRSRDSIKDRFWRNFIDQATPEMMDAWQRFVASQGFSSHMFVVCEFPGGMSS
jgi:hypothetical protein